MLTREESEFAEFLKDYFTEGSFFDTTAFSKIKSKTVIIEILENTTNLRYPRIAKTWRMSIYPFIGTAVFEGTRVLAGFTTDASADNTINLNQMWYQFKTLKNIKKIFSRNNDFNELHEKGVI